MSKEEDREIVLLSEWTTMLSLIEPHLEALGMNYARLGGSVPQKKRQQLVATFRDDSGCLVFITTNSGSAVLGRLAEAPGRLVLDL